MSAFKQFSRLTLAGIVLTLSNAAFSFGFSFNFQTDTVFENIVPVGPECIERVDNGGAILGFQAYLDNMLAACAAQELNALQCQQDYLIGQCISEASIRTFLSQRACQTTADAVVTTTWEWIGMFVQTSGQSTQTFVGIPHTPEAQQQQIIADKQTMIETCFAIQPELIVEVPEVIEEEVIEEEIIEEEVIEEVIEEEVIEEEVVEEVIEEEVIEEEVVEEVIEEEVIEEEVVEEVIEEEVIEEEIVEEVIEEEVIEEEVIDPALLAQGRTFWDAQCAFCHGANGEGAALDPTPVLPGECTVPEAGDCSDVALMADYIAATMPPPGGTCLDDCAAATAALISVGFQVDPAQ